MEDLGVFKKLVQHGEVGWTRSCRALCCLGRTLDFLVITLGKHERILDRGVA